MCAKLMKPAEQETNTSEYVSRSGLVIRILPINPAKIQLARGALAKEMRDNGAILDPPMFPVENAAGDTQWFPHTAETLEEPDNPRQTAINKAMWAAYRQGQADYAAGINERIANVMMRLGTTNEMPEDTSWIAIQEGIGIEVPTDPEDQRVHFLATEALTQAEMGELVALVSLKAQEDIIGNEEMEALFRDVRRSVEEKVRA